MFSTREWHMLLVGGAATKTTTDFATSMNTGEIGVFTPGGVRYTEALADADDPFIIALKTTDGAILQTDRITKADVVSVHLKVGAAAAEQVDFLGYNGSTNSIDAQNDTMYRIRVNFQEGFQNNDHGTTNVKHATYKSDASGAQHEIARGLAKAGNADMSREPKNTSGDPVIVYKAICDEALNTAFDITNNVSVVKGSTTIVVSTNLTYNTAAGTLVVGDFIRIADSNVAPALTSNVYRVVAISSLTVTLDRPYTGASGTLTDAGDSTQVIPSATGVLNNWGVSITGQPQDFTATSANGAKLKYKKTIFNTTVQNFGSTLNTLRSTAPSRGINTFEELVTLETFLRGASGEQVRTGDPNQFAWALQTLDANDPYDTIEIRYKHRIGDMVLADKFKSVIIAVPATAPNYAIAGTADDITDCLEDLLTGVPVYNASKAGTALAAGDLAIS